MPILASDSFTSAAIGSAVEAWPTLKLNVVEKPSGKTGRLQIVLGLVEVELHRLRDRIGAARRLAVGPGRAEQRRAAAEQSRLEHVVIGQRIGDGAAHIDVVERRDLVVHRNEGDGIVLRRRDHLELALGLERLHVARLQVDDEIGVAALDQVGARRRLRHRLDDDPLEGGRLVGRAAIPGLVARHDHLFARLEGFDHDRRRCRRCAPSATPSPRGRPPSHAPWRVWS